MALPDGCRDVSILVLPSYRGATKPGLPSDLGALGVSSEVVQVVEEPAREEFEVRPLSTGAELRTCYLPGTTTPFEAMAFGLCYCTGTSVLVASGGISISPAGVRDMCGAMEEQGADVVVASRFGGGRSPVRHRLLSSLVRWYLRLVTGCPLRDPRSGLKLFRRDVLGGLMREALRRSAPFDPHDLLLLVPRGMARVVEVPAAADFDRAPYPITRGLARQVLLTPFRRAPGGHRPGGAR